MRAGGNKQPSATRKHSHSPRRGWLCFRVVGSFVCQLLPQRPHRGPPDPRDRLGVEKGAVHRVLHRLGGGGEEGVHIVLVEDPQVQKEGVPGVGIRQAVEKLTASSPLPLPMMDPDRHRPAMARRLRRSSCRAERGASVARRVMTEPLSGVTSLWGARGLPIRRRSPARP